jgi:hypothetical protein
MIDSQYPIPDPAWDYARIWDMLQANKLDLNELLTYLGDIEEATPETDLKIQERLRTLANCFETTRQLLDK